MNKQEIISFLNYNYASAINMSRHGDIDLEKYRWVLGIAIIAEIKINDGLILIKNVHDPKARPTLYGIRVDIDYKNREKIELWQNITT